jgi:hypothetical protein
LAGFGARDNAWPAIDLHVPSLSPLRPLSLHFTARRHNPLDIEAHADIGGDLPPESQWRR